MQDWIWDFLGNFLFFKFENCLSPIFEKNPIATWILETFLSQKIFFFKGKNKKSNSNTKVYTV